uniref:tRNA-Ile lysidine synthase n=1 Tax=Ostreobium sp. OS1B TaxID=1851547 RepID=A0A173CTP4_9CHLO|nr:tRNA-Ile lysidine synthase [Ostreobium sp. OS1B]
MQSNIRNLNIFYIKREKTRLIRPLLVLNRFQILKISIFFRLPIYVDSTNKLVNLRRNRLRHQIIPIFKTFFNPRINIALSRVISIINCENSYFTNHLKNIEKFIKLKKFNLQTLDKIQNKKWLIFLPKALQKKFYKILLNSNFKSLTFSEIEFLLRLNILFFK